MIKIRDEKPLVDAIRDFIKLESSGGILLLAGNPHGGEHFKELLAGQILWSTWESLLPTLALLGFWVILRDLGRLAANPVWLAEAAAGWEFGDLGVIDDAVELDAVLPRAVEMAGSLASKANPIVATIRADFLDRPLQHSGLAPLVQPGLELVLASGEVLRFRQTLTFVLDEGRWQAVQMHTSRGVPAAETYGYDIAAGLANIVGSLTAQDGEDITAAAGSSGLVTLMFTDVEDSTRLSHERGEADWIRMVQGHFDSVARIVESDGGTVVKHDAAPKTTNDYVSIMTAAKAKRKGFCPLYW